MKLNRFFTLSITSVIALILTACGSEDSSITSADSKYSMSYKGLVFYEKNIPTSSYKLTTLSDAGFNALAESQKLLVADKLLSSMFFSYPLNELQEKIDSGLFMSTLKDS